MQPLSIALLSALTPAEWERTFFDDRLEPIDYEKPTDLVAISIETFTACRGYEIAREYRKRKVPVIIGGYHATFCPDEVLKNADAVCVGEAEGIWQDILDDALAKRLSGKYIAPRTSNLIEIHPDRSVFDGRNYFKIALVETGRGCHFKCSFCSITAFHQATYRRKSVDFIVDEIKEIKEKVIFFVDDNIVGDNQNLEALFKALVPLKIKWVSQASLNLTKNEELLDLMVKSGCEGLLVGFESLNRENLKRVGKSVNLACDYEQAIKILRRHGIPVYGTFMFGLDGDSTTVIADTVKFARKQKLFMAAFNHVVPFPGTPLYEELLEQNRLIDNP